jgi:hypothetical protein
MDAVRSSWSVRWRCSPIAQDLSGNGVGGRQKDHGALLIPLGIKQAMGIFGGHLAGWDGWRGLLVVIGRGWIFLGWGGVARLILGR